MKITAMLLVAFVSAASASAELPQLADPAVITGCALQSSFAREVVTLRDKVQRYQYAAASTRLPEGEATTTIMLLGHDRALLIEAVVSGAGVAIVNVASSRLVRCQWTLEETHAGPSTAQYVREIAAKLVKQFRRSFPASANAKAVGRCSGIGLP